MKVVLWCGGQGMRMREYSDRIPKPMVPIGIRPILWHLMRLYSHHGNKDFVLCLGYQADKIKDYFLSYREELSNDFVLSNGGDVELLSSDIDDWNITFVDTGLSSNVGTRLFKVREHVQDEEYFLANYADGLSDVPVNGVIDKLKASGKAAAFVTVRPSQSFHLVDLEVDGTVASIGAATQAGVWVNGGFFVLTPRVFDFMNEGEELVEEPFQRLIEAGELLAYPYEGFWVGMDTFKDREELDKLHAGNQAPWELWRSGSCQ